MSDILAIVSKSVFEKDARVGGRIATVGDVWPVDRYNTNSKGLAPLAKGGRIFLVTVRPPDEKLWLVGVIDSPKLTGNAWVSATKNAMPVTDITALRKTIAFESGKGMSQDKGALGMSLQTPRTLTASDVALILGPGGVPKAAARAAPPQAAPTGNAALLAQITQAPNDEAVRERVARKLVASGEKADARKAFEGLAHLNAHDEGTLPCLCKRCWEGGPATWEHGGVSFTRDFVVKGSRLLFFWAPSELFKHANPLRNSVRGALTRRLADLAVARKRHRYARSAF